MSTEMIVLIVAIVVLIVALAKLGMPISGIIKASKLPAWANWDHRVPWGATWIDGQEWAKKIIIKFGQVLIVVALFVINFFLALLMACGKGAMKAIEATAGTAKKAVK